MSVRTHIVGLKSIDQLRDVVGSKDKALAKALKERHRKLLEEEWGDLDDLEEADLEEVQEELEEFANEVDRLINGSSTKGVEPGAWVYVLELILEEWKRKQFEDLPINKGYKHYHAWKPYRERMASSVTPAAVVYLKHMENGRPMQGQEVEHDGALFAWLTTEEIAELHKSLASTVITDSELQQFHDDLVQSLAILKAKKASLFMIAH